jgi:DNA replication and repair protein RecF
MIFDFSPGINCIFGQNGNGKTNLLEAIYLITNKKSFRKNTSYSQMINIEGGSSEIILQSVFENNQELISYSLRMTDQIEERYLNNQFEKSKTPSASVFINPFDSYNFHTSSTFRRQWIDSHLSLINKEYKQVLGRFQKAMRFRNSVLGLGGKSASIQLQAIDEQVSEYSAFITQARLDFIKDLNQFITPTFKAIFSEDHQLELELEAQMTKIGIHRDDTIFSFDGLNAFEFCSLGQQKMAFLSLIFAYIELFRYKFTSYPIVLIDDVSGELDGQRWKNLIQYLETKQFQVMITTANENFRKELERISNSRKFLIENGLLINPG